MIRKIILHPDPVLRQICEPVTWFDEMLDTLIADMFETMYDAPGRGLAAPQVGIPLRLFVMDATWKEGTRGPQVLVNPEVIGASEATQTLEEGCLSIPGILTPVTRPAVVKMRWQDQTGQAMEGEFSGFASACTQHELDHLNGVLSIDYQEKPNAG